MPDKSVISSTELSLSYRPILTLTSGHLPVDTIHLMSPKLNSSFPPRSLLCVHLLVMEIIILLVAQIKILKAILDTFLSPIRTFEQSLSLTDSTP